MTRIRIRLNVIQEKFWMDDLLKSPSTEYNDPNHTFIIKGNLSLPVLKEAYRKIMVEYPPFCSTIEVDNGNPYFVPQENFELPFKLLTIDENTDAEHIEKMLSDLVNVPFNLGRELPCRFCCIRKGELHYLFHSFHHLVIDGMSIRTFFDRLTTIYNKLMDNRYVAENQMEQLLQFNKVLDSQFKTNNAADSAYWKHYIEDVPVKVILPQTVYDNTKTTDAPNTWRFRLGEEMDSKVSGLCKQCNTTHFRVYSAVWALTLSKVLNTSAIALDHALNMRPKGSPLLGVFVNNFPIRYPFSEFSDKSFTDLLEYSNSNRMAEQQHIFAIYGDYLPKTQNAIRDSFNFSINYPLKLDELTVDFKDCEVLDWRHVNTNVSAELLLVIDADKQLTCDLRYKQTISLDYVKMLAHTFGYILRQVADNPKVMLSQIRLIDSQRQQELIEIEQANLQLASNHDPFTCMFKKQAMEHANHIAVVHQEQEITYSELDKRSDVLARKLHAMGIVRSNIGIALPKTIDMIVAILATLKSGNTYVPIDIHHPKERIAFIVNDASLRLVFTHRETRDMFGTLPCLDPSAADISADDESVALPQVVPGDVAYIIYTSGTTGKPKGVPIRHSMLSQTIVNNIALQKMTEESRVMQFANIVFDASVVEIFPSLAIGATLYLPLEEERKDTNLLLTFLSRHKITHINIPPVLLVTLPHTDLPDLKTIVVGGDLTNNNVIEFWSKDRLFINAYGPTENCVDVTYNIVTPRSAVNDIGTSMPGVASYVLDSHQNMVPDYAVGELYIGGVKLSDGYINRPDLNQTKFISNPFASDDDRKNHRNLVLYKSGDLVMRDGNGHLLFLGRTDHQVKLNGFRIELGEVESIISEFGNGIKNVLAMIRENNGNKMLVAYLLVPDVEKFPVDELKAHILSRLPSYMVPSAIVPLTAFPYNTSGKIDRQKLPMPVSETDLANYNAPTTLTERRLVKIWGDLLNKDFIDSNDSFLSLGGDSIMVIKLVYEIHKHFGISVNASNIYENPTLEGMARLIDTMLDNTDDNACLKLLTIAKEVMGTEEIDADTDLFEAGMDKALLDDFVHMSASTSNVFFTTFDVLKFKSIRNLIANIDRNLYSWGEGADETKPVIIYFNGFVESYPYNMPVISSFEKNFSVFNIESIYNFFIGGKDVSLQVLFETYEDLMMVALRDKQVLFLTGYCIGAEIAIAFAKFMSQRHPGINLSVVNIEAVYDRKNYYFLNLDTTQKSNDRRLEIFDKVYADMPELNYDGTVVNIMVNKPILHENQANDEDKTREENEKITKSWRGNIDNWNSHYPASPCHLLECNHMEVRDRKDILDRIQDIVLNSFSF